MSLAVQAVLASVAWPAGAAAVAVAAGLLWRRAGDYRRLADAAAPIALAASLWATYVAVHGLPPWAPREALRLVPWIALGMALVGVAEAALRRDGAIATGLMALIVVACGVAASWKLVVATGGGRWQAVMLTSGGVAAAWFGLDALAARTGARTASLATTVWVAGAALVVALGHTAAIAQLVGAIAVGTGLLFVATWLRGGPVSIRAAGGVAAVTVGVALASAHLFADLSRAAWLSVATAPVLAALATLGKWRKRVPRLAMVAPVIALAILLALAAGAAEAPRPVVSAKPGSVEAALEQGYELLGR